MYFSVSSLSRAVALSALAFQLSACANVPQRRAPFALGDPVSVGSIVGGSRSGDGAVSAGARCSWHSSQASGLSLSTAIERALCAHPKINDARAALSAERAQRHATMGSLLPNVSAAASRSHSENASESTFGPSETVAKGTARSLTVGWLLYDFGGRSAQIESATELVIAAAAGQDLMLQNAFATVTETYFSVITNKALARVAEASIANARQMLSAVALREKLGAATNADREYARLGVAQATLVASRIDEQLQLSKGDLASALHLDPDTPITLASASAEQDFATEYFTRGTSEKISALIRNVESHPQIRAATARANSAKAQIAIAGSEHMPKVTMVGNYYVNGRPGSSVSSTPSTEKFLGVSLAVPIFDGFTTLNRLKAARAQHERSVAQLEDTRGQVKSAIWKAHQSSILSAKSLNAAQASVSSANAARKQAQIRYRDGAGDISEWLRAEKSYFDAQIDVIRAQSEIRQARLRLVVALGHLGSWAFEQSPQTGRNNVQVRKQAPIK